MLPSDMELRIKTGTVGYNNKILVSDGNFSLGKNDEVNSLKTPAMKSYKTNSLETPAIESHSNAAQGLTHAPTLTKIFKAGPWPAKAKFYFSLPR